ncbi:MAG: hypothetical protein KAH03_00075 [Cocleimonas sp.]|nr:hypothetical protein [Cocleimonas sp.]
MSSPDNPTLIPVISDLVVPGDPLLKKEAYEKMSAESAYADNLNQRINELESAIGQDDMTSLSRAYAIREEASRAKYHKSDYSDDQSESQDESITDTEIKSDSTQK